MGYRWIFSWYLWYKFHVKLYPSIYGWWLSPTPLTNMTSSVGMMTFPIYGKIKNVPNHQYVLYIPPTVSGKSWNSMVPVTTNQISIHGFSPTDFRCAKQRQSPRRALRRWFVASSTAPARPRLRWPGCSQLCPAVPSPKSHGFFGWFLIGCSWNLSQ